MNVDKRATDARERPLAFVPGHVLITVSIPVAGSTDSPPDVQVRLRRAAAQVLGDLEPRPGPPANRKSDVPIVLPGARGDVLTALLSLGAQTALGVRQAVERLNSERGRRVLEAEGLVLVGATPNWFSAAQQDCVGGSPGSQPVPAQPKGRRLRYSFESESLELMDDAGASSWARAAAVHVAILDTVPGGDLHQRAEAFPDNAHFRAVLDRLEPAIGTLSAGPLEERRREALAEIEQTGHFFPATAERTPPLDVQDHGLFVASAIHAVAPWARLRLVRVLNNYGVGTLEGVLTALAGIIAEKPSGSPLVINLSLGLLPPLEQLPALWYGLPIPGLPGTRPDPALKSATPGGADGDWLARNRAAVSRQMRLLERPAQRAVDQLLDNNCLIVAAAGNDSFKQERTHRRRCEPRVPARFDNVLGVAATARGQRAAAYSNIGDAPVLGNAIATFGGGVASDGRHPRAGVKGIYSAATFPASGTANLTGWAEWSGTSFATALASGLAANMWAVRSEQANPDAAAMLAIVNDAVRADAPADVAGLNVPPTSVREEWQA